MRDRSLWTARASTHTQAHGFGTVYQEGNLLTNRSVEENGMLGRQQRRLGLVR